METEPESFDRRLPLGSIVAHKVNGFQKSMGISSEPGELRGAKIMNSKPLTEEQAARVRSIFTTETSFGDKGTRCFFPGLGFTIGTGPETVEILICLQCMWAYFFRGEETMREPLSASGHEKLAEIYVELFPGNNPAYA